MFKKLSRRNFINKSFFLSAGIILWKCVPRDNERLSGGRRKYDIGEGKDAGNINLKSKYQEAPMLAERVARGELPPVEERLPVNPFVRHVESIGKYGGTLYDQAENQGGRFALDGTLIVCPQETNNEGTIIRPHVCEKVEFNKNYTEFTFYLREGIKWSDGVEMTADDVIWWWENDQMNKEVRPEGPRTFKVGNDYAVFKKVDKSIFKILFPVPFKPCINLSAHAWMSFGDFFAQPAHWMKQFHIDFNPKANELARSFGYQAWYQLYRERDELMRPYINKPHIGPWTRVVSETTYDIYERNPYFFEVDQAGNQLPYIDLIYVAVVEDRKLREARTATGAVSLGVTEFSQIYIYKKNEKKAGFKIKKWQLANSSECMFAFNLNHKDPVLRNIYNDLRFRQAMSYAINRKRINDKLYFGLAKECQATLNPSVSFFSPEWMSYCAQYDKEKANKLLDEMGLRWDNERRHRLRPDGKKLVTVVIFNKQTFPVELLELVRQDWSMTGMETILNETDFRFRLEKCKSGNHDCTCWNADLVEEIGCYMPWVIKWIPYEMTFYAMDWWNWYYSGGKAGTKPPQEWINQFNRMANWYKAKDEEEYRRLGREVWDFFCKQLVCIGTVGYAPKPVVVKNGLKNVKEIIKMGYGTVWAKSYMVQTFYWDKPEEHL